MFFLFFFGSILSLVVLFFTLRMYSEYYNYKFSNDDLGILFLFIVFSFIGSWISLFTEIFAILYFKFFDDFLIFLNKGE